MKLSRYLPSANPPQTPFEKDVDRSLDKQFTETAEILNNGIRFLDNFDGFIVTLTTDATPGVETAIAHGLKRVPTGCLVLEKNKAAHIFSGPTAKDSTTYYIQSDVAEVLATVMIF